MFLCKWRGLVKKYRYFTDTFSFHKIIILTTEIASLFFLVSPRLVSFFQDSSEIPELLISNVSQVFKVLQKSKVKVLQGSSQVKNQGSAKKHTHCC